MWAKDLHKNTDFQVGALVAAVAILTGALASSTVPGGRVATGLGRYVEAGYRPGPAGPTGPRGSRGPHGLTGFAGSTGPRGRSGPDAAASRLRKQNVSINWQNGDFSGRDRESFEAPGIGHGVVRCSPPTSAEPNGTQWVRFFPNDQKDDTVMWTVRAGGPPGDEEVSVVRTARREGNTGPDFYEGMNTSPTGIDATSTGTFTGIISSRATRNSNGAAPNSAPAATTFQLSWHWSFFDQFGPRCYVAGSFYTDRG